MAVKSRKIRISSLPRELAVSCNVEDYKIGFGSFVDKELSPYISLVTPENCQQVTKNCPPPYR